MLSTTPDTSSIRPLGEEHLRMFKRAIDTVQNSPPKVKIPDEAVKGKVGLSTKKVICSEATQQASLESGRIANILEVFMDAQFMEKIDQMDERGTLVWVDLTGAPLGGWYVIDRKKGCFLAIDKYNAAAYETNSRLRVSYGSHRFYKKPTVRLFLMQLNRHAALNDGLYHDLDVRDGESRATASVAIIKDKSE